MNFAFNNNRMPYVIGAGIVGASALASVFWPDSSPMRPQHAAAAYSFMSSDGTISQLRFTPTTRPYQPEAQTPPIATTENSDTGKPAAQWQRLTDDWGGGRPWLEDHGIAFNGTLASYLGDNFRGGATTAHGGASYLFDLNVTLDSKKLLNYDGGTFFANFRQQNGLHNSLDGSFGATSHLDVPDRTQLSEIWYQQVLADNKLRVKVGKIDADTEFDHSDNGGEFLNDFGGESPTVLAFPTDPDPAFGADAFFTPNDNFYAGAGAYDGSGLEGVETGTLGPAKLLNGPQSWFLIGEIGAQWTGGDSGRAGRIGAGVWHHSGEIARFDGGNDNGSTGPYLTFDQVLWRKNPSDDDDQRGIAMFTMAGYGDPAVSAAKYQVGGGAKWTGPIEGRDADILGAGVSYIAFTGAAGAGFNESGETTVETFYKFRFNPWFSVQPDLQYVHNPGGTSTKRDALIGIVQILVDF